MGTWLRALAAPKAVSEHERNNKDRNFCSRIPWEPCRTPLKLYWSLRHFYLTILPFLDQIRYPSQSDSSSSLLIHFPLEVFLSISLLSINLILEDLDQHSFIRDSKGLQHDKVYNPFSKCWICISALEEPGTEFGELPESDKWSQSCHILGQGE